MAVSNSAFSHINADGNAPTAETATVETSTSAHMTNRLAWINIHAISVLVMMDLMSIFSLPMRFLIIDPSRNASKAKLAKFFMIFRIFQR